MREFAPTAEVRSIDTATGEFEVAAVTYGRVDSHGTVWRPGVFLDSVRERMPVAHFNHYDDPGRLIARFVDWREEPDQFVLIGQMEKRERSTWVRRAWDGLRSKVLTDFSVVFSRRPGGWREGPDGVTEFTSCDLHRCDLVLDGSVPGAELLAFRATQASNPITARLAYAERQVNAGRHRTIAQPVRAAEREADEVLRRIEGSTRSSVVGGLVLMR